jgi:ABC-type nitrate/sulfonate/bicarbonate transport system substrate-binding protein
LLLIAALPAFAQTQPLRVIAFAGASNLPVWHGQQAGLFARHGVEVALAFTPNSVQLARDMMAGTHDLALTSIDNVIAYNEGQGEAELPAPADFVALAGVDDGLLSVMAAPGIQRIEDLAGRTVSVDAMTTGFAFVLREILGRANVQANFVRVGGGAQRLAALLAGQQDATLLNAPLDLVAEAQGFRRLVRATDVIGPYQGIVAMARRGTADAQADAIVGFLRGFRDSVLALDADRAAAAALLRARSQGMTEPAAARAVEVLLHPERGIRRDLSISTEGVTTVLRLRSAYAQPPRPLTDPARYMDDRLRQRALAPN